MLFHFGVTIPAPEPLGRWLASAGFVCGPLLQSIKLIRRRTRTEPCCETRRQNLFSQNFLLKLKIKTGKKISSLSVFFLYVARIFFCSFPEFFWWCFYFFLFFLFLNSIKAAFKTPTSRTRRFRQRPHYTCGWKEARWGEEEGTASPSCIVTTEFYSTTVTTVNYDNQLWLASAAEIRVGAKNHKAKK